MYQLIIIVHVLLGLGVVGLILMQQGKGADAGAAFSGGGSNSVFGAQGAASFLSRTTAVLAALFFTTSLGLAVLSGYENKPDDLMDQPDIVQPLDDVPLLGNRQPAEKNSEATQEIPITTNSPEFQSSVESESLSKAKVVPIIEDKGGIPEAEKPVEKTISTEIITQP